MRKLNWLMLLIAPHFISPIFIHAQTSQLSRRVLVVGWDGSRGDVVHDVVWVKNKAPHLKRLMSLGQYTTCVTYEDVNCAKAHSGRYLNEDKLQIQSTTYRWMTGPGWASVTTGQDADVHGVGKNSTASLKAFSLSTRKHPTFFTRAKRLGLKTAAAGVGAFLTSHTTNSNSSSLYYGVVDYECGVDANNRPVVPATATESCNLDQRLTLKNSDAQRDEKLTVALLGWLDNRELSLIMGVYDEIDGAGHSDGFDFSDKYLRAITVADEQLGRLMAKIEERTQKFDEEWLVVLTSDHGGHDTAFGGGHSDKKHKDEVIPFVITAFGKATQQPRFLKAPVRQMDAFSAVMSWLDSSDYQYAKNR